MTKQLLALYNGPYNMTTEPVGKFLLKHHIPFATVTDQDIHGGCLDRFRAICFTGGDGPVMSSQAEENVKKFIKTGGGYIGICSGMKFAKHLGILDAELLDVRGIGWYFIRILRNHPVTEGLTLSQLDTAPPVQGADTVRIVRCNGEYIVPGDPQQILASYDTAGKLGAVVAGDYGVGRFVVFSPHPEEPVQSPPDWEWNSWQDPALLMLNAIRYAAGDK